MENVYLLEMQRHQTPRKGKKIALNDYLIFGRYLFPGLFWRIRCFDSDVALQHSTKGRSVTQGVRIERCILGQIYCLSGCALWIGIIFNWTVGVSSQNAVLHGRRWPHFQVRMARSIETGRIIRLEELCSVQINAGDGYLIRLGRSRANSFSSSSIS